MMDKPDAMNCPRCAGAKLVASMTKQGVEVDHCRSCGGVWLDKGEIFYFTRSAKALVAELGRAKRSAGTLPSPVTGQPMQRLVLFDRIEIDTDWPITVELVRGATRRELACGRGRTEATL